jgi:hypothetical protein
MFSWARFSLMSHRLTLYALFLASLLRSSVLKGVYLCSFPTVQLLSNSWYISCLLCLLVSLSFLI